MRPTGPMPIIRTPNVSNHFPAASNQHGAGVWPSQQPRPQASHTNVDVAYTFEWEIRDSALFLIKFNTKINGKPVTHTDVFADQQSLFVSNLCAQSASNFIHLDEFVGTCPLSRLADARTHFQSRLFHLKQKWATNLEPKKSLWRSCRYGREG